MLICMKKFHSKQQNRGQSTVCKTFFRYVIWLKTKTEPYTVYAHNDHQSYWKEEKVETGSGSTMLTASHNRIHKAYCTLAHKRVSQKDSDPHYISVKWFMHKRVQVLKEDFSAKLQTSQSQCLQQPLKSKCKNVKTVSPAFISNFL